MSKISYINSSGLNLLVRLLTKVRNKGGELVLITLSESVEKLFFITKLNSIFTICADLSEAQNIFNAQEA
jgi:anti-sigma B factor antagonist